MTKRKGYRDFKLRLGIFYLIAIAALAIWAPNADARSTFFNDRGCVGCHSAAGTTCNGCHHHGPSGLGFATVAAGKTTATPGETMTLSFTGGSQSGWIRAILYRDNVEIARSTGTATGGMVGGAGFPITFTTTAPTPSGATQTYTYAAAWFGNTNDSGSAHAEQRATTTIPITVTANNPVPAVTSLSPSSATAGGAGRRRKKVQLTTGVRIWLISIKRIRLTRIFPCMIVLERITLKKIHSIKKTLNLMKILITGYVLPVKVWNSLKSISGMIKNISFMVVN